jgi:hypothetical protein
MITYLLTMLTNSTHYGVVMNFPCFILIVMGVLLCLVMEPPVTS